MAETTATMARPRLRVAVMSSATCSRPPGLSRSEPPNFWTTTLMISLPGLPGLPSLHGLQTLRLGRCGGLGRLGRPGRLGRLEGCFRCEQSHLDYPFRDLDGVERGAFSEVVGHGEEGQAPGFVEADPAHQARIAAGGEQRRGHASRTGIVDQFHAWGDGQQLARARSIERPLELRVD